MPAPKPATVDAYVAAQPAPVRKWLRLLRSTVRKAVPQAVEVIAYGMPGFKLDGRPLLYYAAWKGHLALYPGSRSTFERFKDALAPYETDKGTIRLPLDEAVDKELVAAIAAWRADEVRAATEKKPRTTRTKPR